MNIEELIRDSVDDMVREVPARSNLADDALRQARRHQRAAQVTVASCAVVALGGGAVLASSAIGPRQEPSDSVVQPAGSGPQASSATEAESDILPAPSSTMLTDSELSAAFETCRAGGEEYYEGWQPTFGLTIDADVDARTATTWVAARRGDHYRADCALDADGNFVAGGGEYGGKSTPALLYALVDGQESDGVGRYVEPVATVTVQAEDSPEQQAVLHGGFWFFPTTTAGELQEDIRKTAEAEETAGAPGFSDYDLIGVPYGYTIRGYDAGGDLVYSSAEDGPSVEDCYANPNGSEIVGNGAGATDASECVRTYEWTPLL